MVSEQLIRPTGLLDPEMEIRPIRGQVEDCIEAIKEVVSSGNRALVTTLTKRMSEDLTEYLRKGASRLSTWHSDVDAIERVEILRNLRAGSFDALIGVNLLREGLDLPEVALVAILDADKEGFLRSETSLIQNSRKSGKAPSRESTFYADVMTKSLQAAWDICKYRRETQQAYNQANGITPKSVSRPIQESLRSQKEEEDDPLLVSEKTTVKEVKKLIKQLEKEMLEAVKKLEFEKAALLRDQISFLQGNRATLHKKTISKGKNNRKRYGSRQKTK